MTFEQIERLAYERGVMPKSANTIENACYQAMAYLYSRYRAGQIDIDRAKVAKKEIRAAFNRDDMLYRMYMAGERRYKAVSRIMTDIEKHGSEDAKQLIRIMDGRERIIDEREEGEK